MTGQPSLARVAFGLRGPLTLSFQQAAVVPMSATTALQALRDLDRVEPGHQVLVIGASGGVGIYAVQVAKYLGATGTHVHGHGGDCRR